MIRDVASCLLAAGLMIGLETVSPTAAAAADPPPREAFLAFVRAQADALRQGDQPPRNLEEWRARRGAIRAGLLDAWGGFPTEPCPLEPRIVGTIARQGYRIEKLVFQTMPGVFMTANAYVPDAPGKHPAILQVHGHWRGAKQDPVVQSRCLGAVKLGFFVLAVDAFGAGERGVGEALGEYHGEMTGATLLPIGRPLSGLQVYENLRAVDYLRTRPEVDTDHIGVTGASGGGNQSMYAGAWDERLGAVVPVCSVGNFRAYLGIACCICELVPGALRFTEEAGVLGLTAPRALMVVNATRDASQFSVAEARKSIAAAGPIFGLLGEPDHLRHAVFESGHDYNKDMREAMYGWMTLHLKGDGTGAPIPEPSIKVEDPESLRCYPGQTRPDDWVTIPRFAAIEARRLLASRRKPTNLAELRAVAEASRRALANRVLNLPEGPSDPAPPTLEDRGAARVLTFHPERGLTLSATVEPGAAPDSTLAVVLELDGSAKASAGPIAAAVRRQGWGLATVDLRATGVLAWPSDAIGQAPDHNTAEWAVWIGRPLLGQWVADVRELIDAVERSSLKRPLRIVVIGEGPAGVVALSAGALDPRITGVAAVRTLASFVTETPYRGQRLGILAPGILREVGDVGQIAALIAPRRVVVAGGVAGDGTPLPLDRVRAAHEAAMRAWDLESAGDRLTIMGSEDASAVVEALR